MPFDPRLNGGCAFAWHWKNKEPHLCLRNIVKDPNCNDVGGDFGQRLLSYPDTEPKYRNRKEARNCVHLKVPHKASFHSLANSRRINSNSVYDLRTLSARNTSLAAMRVKTSVLPTLMRDELVH